MGGGRDPASGCILAALSSRPARLSGPSLGRQAEAQDALLINIALAFSEVVDPLAGEATFAPRPRISPGTRHSSVPTLEGDAAVRGCLGRAGIPGLQARAVIEHPQGVASDRA